MKSVEVEHDNAKINDLKKQMKVLLLDYDDMIKAREEAKKQLDAKFEDVYRKINSCHEFTSTESKRVTDTLKAFQVKFEHQISIVESELNDKIDKFQKFINDTFSNINDKLDLLEKLIEEEKEERIRDTEEQLNPIREKVNTLSENFEIERSVRIDQKKELLQNISDQAFKITEGLDKEITEKNLKQCQLKDSFRNELSKMVKFVEEFQKDMFEKTAKMRMEVEEEIKTRFAHQDEIINNMSIFLHTFQETLKIVGGSK